MEILEFVSWRFRRLKTATILLSAFLCIIALFLAVPLGIDPGKGQKGLLYFSMCTIMLAIIAMWITSARGFEEKVGRLPQPNYRSSGASEHVQEIQNEYHSRIYFMPKPGEGAYICVCKALCLFAWVLLLILYSVGLAQIQLPVIHYIYLLVLTLVATALNGSSYYLCCMFVWYIGHVSKSPAVNTIAYVDSAPSCTLFYVELSSVAKSNYLTFLVVSLFFSVSMLFAVLMLPSGDRTIPIICLAVVLVVGLLTFAILFACSHIFLGRLLQSWRYRSLKRLEARRGTSFSQPGYRESAASIMRGSDFDRTDVLALIVAAATIAANVLSALRM